MLAKSTYFCKAENRLPPLARPTIPQTLSQFYSVSKDLDGLFMKTSFQENSPKFINEQGLEIANT